MTVSHSSVPPQNGISCSGIFCMSFEKTFSCRSVFRQCPGKQVLRKVPAFRKLLPVDPGKCDVFLRGARGVGRHWEASALTTERRSFPCRPLPAATAPRSTGGRTIREKGSAPAPPHRHVKPGFAGNYQGLPRPPRNMVGRPGPSREALLRFHPRYPRPLAPLRNPVPTFRGHGRRAWLCLSCQTTVRGSTCRDPAERA